MSMNPKLRDENIDFLFKGILELKNIDECYGFFEDLCTVAELKAMSQRAVVAKMLRDKHVYSDIVARTGASTATISRVNRSLNYGSDGYDMIFICSDTANIYVLFYNSEEIVYYTNDKNYSSTMPASFQAVAKAKNIKPTFR